MKQLALDIGPIIAPTLDNFFAGPNEEALSHLRLWTASLNPCPVPTYLWGERGSGKTHLLHAAHHALSELGAQVGWLDPHTMEPPDFNDEWTAVLMDDVHLYNSTQQHAAFNFFVNALTPRNGQPRWVLAAGGLPPADLRLRDDLRTRLAWGHVLALQVLGETDRRAVLRLHADARGLLLSDDVMAYILSRFSRDMDSLMQLFNRMDQYAMQTQRALTIPLVRAMMENE